MYTYVCMYMVRIGTYWKTLCILGIRNHLNVFFILRIFRGKTKTHLEDRKKCWKEMPDLLSNRNDRKQRHTNTHKKSVCGVCMCVYVR